MPGCISDCPGHRWHCRRAGLTVSVRATPPCSRATTGDELKGVDKQTQTPKIKRRSRAEIEQLVAEFEASGLGRTAFCQQRGLSLSTLTRYRKRPQHTAGGI